ncbi:MAG: hydrogenase maturation nickel metallochaperone HypA [Candidatus Latescibacteria bacterium]|nr:hydrogenase maturation nickel metallochaperone HypA [Candidatus Latescibacterota bacterium]
MHELSIAQNIVESVRASIVEYPDCRVQSITLSVGEYSGIDPEALQFTFPIAAENTILQDTRLIINRVALTVMCKYCASESINVHGLQCPRCGSTNVTLTAGRELEIASIDLIIPDEEPEKENCPQEE